MKKQFIFISILIISSTINAQESLVANYPFNGNANDESGNGHNGTVIGATLSTDRFGNENSAYYFDGNNYISVAENSIFNAKESGFTFSFWTKPDVDNTKSWATLMAFGDYGHGGYRVYYNKAHKLFFSTNFYNYGGNEAFVIKEGVTNNVWYMCTFTYKSGVLKQYINGIFHKQVEAKYYPSAGGDNLMIGEGFAGYIDDISIFSEALTDLEVAKLSGLSGAIRATELDAYSLADFEHGILQPVKHSAYWDVWGNHGDGYIKVVENPVKSGSNRSDYVGVAVTFPSSVVGESDCDKAEYVLTTAKGLADEHHHIMRWKLLLADSAILKIETILWDWMYFNQIHTGCGKYPRPHIPEPTIAYSGGIFNDCRKASNNDPSLYQFRYRAMPDSASVPFHINIGEWMSFTYEIFWTHSDKGYWRVWKDGELLAYADNVKTLPDCCDEDANYLHFKTGLYNRWNDPEITRLPLFFDDIELYISDDISVEDICPECSTTLDSDKIKNKQE